MKKLFYIFIFLFTNLFSNDSFDIKSFGTIGAVYNDNKSYSFRKDALQKNGSNKDVYFLTDTIFGIQTTYNINENSSFLAQIIANRNENDNNRLKTDSAYLKYDSSDNFLVKIGRIRTPYYKNSNNMNIGYSRLMIREPIEVYGQVPFTSYNGIALIYSNILDKYFYTIQTNFGKEKLNTPIHSQNENAITKIDNIKALNVTFGTDTIETRLTYMHGKASSQSKSLNTLFGTLRNFNLNELANKYEFENKTSQYFGLGLFIDYNNFIFQSEYGQREADSFYANMHGYYGTFAYRIKNFIPYISYAKSKMDQDLDINSGVNELNQLLKIQNVSQTSNTLGFKYYINKNLDFKFEYQQIKPNGLYGGFYLSDDNYPNSKLNVYSFVIDFVF